MNYNKERCCKVEEERNHIREMHSQYCQLGRNYTRIKDITVALKHPRENMLLLDNLYDFNDMYDVI